MLCRSPPPPPPPPHCSLDNVADSGLWKHPLMLSTKEVLREIYSCSVEVLLLCLFILVISVEVIIICVIIYILLVLWVMLQTRGCGNTH